MSHEKRPYTKKRRAEMEEETRLRITQSAVELHGSVGPSRTSMSAVADRAGVTRSTLYRHFADEAALFDACSSHWAQEHPFPDLGAWASIDDPDERLAVALRELYGFYHRTEQMLANLYRDEETVPVVRERFRGFRQALVATRDILMTGRGARGRARQRTRAAIGHAVAFGTWRSLTREQGLDGEQAVDLMCRLVDAAALRR